MSVIQKMWQGIQFSFSFGQLPRPNVGADVAQQLFDWLQKVQQGEDGAMAEFMKLAQYRLILLGHGHSQQMRGKEETPDLVQDSLIILYNNILKQHFTNKDHLDAFLRTILQNARISRQRYFFKAGKRSSIREVGSVDSLEDSQAPSPISEVVSAEDLEWLAKSLKILSDKEQAILKMRHHEDMTWEEIGQKVGVSGEAARKAHSRILGLLRSAMGLKVKVDWVE